MKPFRFMDYSAITLVPYKGAGVFYSSSSSLEIIFKGINLVNVLNQFIRARELAGYDCEKSW